MKSAKPKAEKKTDTKAKAEKNDVKASAAKDAEKVEAPAKSALKAEWIAYRVATGELTEAEAKKLTKDQLIEYQG